MYHKNTILLLHTLKIGDGEIVCFSYLIYYRGGFFSPTEIKFLDLYEIQIFVNLS